MEVEVGMSTVHASPGIAAPAPASSPRARRDRPRINLRLILLLAVVCGPFLYFGYVIFDQSIHGGVTKREGYYDVDLKSLGYFPFDASKDTKEDVPAKWRELDGKRVALQGEMFVDSSAGSEVNRFQLVYSIQKCCFNGPPKVQERVFAQVPNNGKVPYYSQIVRVVGTLRVAAHRNEVGQIDRLYELDVESVDPA